MLNESKINEIKDIIIDKIKPEKIILFGSYAKGNQKENSDLDLLVIVKESRDPRFKRAREVRKYLWGITDTPKDILVYTTDEINYWKDVEFSFINTVVKNGKNIYEKK